MVLFSPKIAQQEGSFIASKTNGKELTSREYVSFYGREPEEVYEIWQLCHATIKQKTLPKHLFWTLMYLKMYISWDCMCVLLDASKTTLMKWIWVWIEAIASKHTEVIVWEKRKQNSPDSALCFVTVDGTDFLIGEPSLFDKRWKSPKQKGASVKYEIAIAIFSGDIVWVNGPHEGSTSDTTIFSQDLLKVLDEDKKVETDAGYKGLQDYIRSRDTYKDDTDKNEKSEIRARHETCNHRFKEWGILKQQFRNEKEKHALVFFAVAVMTQLRIDSGKVLFGVAPTSRKESRYYI